MTRKFTGRHMTMVMFAFFAVVVGVNITMARLAVGTFGGTVVDNSYVASQRYNHWLVQARRQAALGWTAVVATDQARRMVVSITAANVALEGGSVSATATHPVGALPPVTLTFARDGKAFRSTRPLPPGRWLVHIDVNNGTAHASFDTEIAS